MTISKLLIHKDVVDVPMVAHIVSQFDIPFRVVDETKTLFEGLAEAKDPIQRGKETLLLTRNKGKFIKECPGTRSYTCCGYKILHIGTFCTMDCSYCILQSYFHPPICQFFVNHDDLFAELDHYLSHGERSRIGTGEFTDSLLWGKWSDLNTRLVKRFAHQTRSVLELKTKTVSIAPFASLDHRRKTILSWSLNTVAVSKAEERGTATMPARLRAAQTCESWGYPIAFHFDPVVIYEGCEDDYEDMIKKMFMHVSPQNIVWISIGTFRFMPQLKSIVQQRFSDSSIIYGEFIPGLDGKMRYFKPLRIRIYQHMVSVIRKIAPDVTVYFCMEDDDVWSQVMGYLPSERGGLSAILDESATRICGLRD
jgi:DNA repair photolyase